MSNANMPPDHTKYIVTVERLKDVKAGKRGWVSLTQEEKLCGVPKGNLKVVAEALGLVVTNHGRYGLTASSPHVKG